MIKSIEGNFNHPEVNELLTKHFIELRSASPEGSTHVLDIPGLKVPSIKFWSFWEKEKLLGCGALKFLDKEHGEFKSIRVSNKFRNQGNGYKVINHLINEAKKLNIKRLSLETGAGDFFAGGYLFGLQKGLNLTQSVEIANKSAAHVISEIGVRPKNKFN